MAEQEIWKDVLGYEGAYLVSSLGRVKSLVAKTPGLIRRQRIRPDGYMQVQLKVGQKPTNRLVHTLVDEAFNGPRVDSKEVNHKDGIKHHNSIANLERVTRSENTMHALSTGLKIPYKGIDHGRAILTEAKVIEIRAAAGNRNANGRFAYGVVASLAREDGYGFGEGHHDP